MKKFFVLITSLIIVFSIAGCGVKEETPNNVGPSSQPTSTTEPSDESTSNASDDTPSGIDLPYTFKDPDKPLAFDYPNMKSIEEAASQIFKNSKYVIAYCMESKSADLKDITNELKGQFTYATRTHLEGDPEDIIVETEEASVINGVPVLKVVGSVVSVYDSNNKIKLPMQGYVFEKDGAIFELIAVLSEEKNDVNYKEMQEVIDAIIKTIRDDR